MAFCQWISKWQNWQNWNSINSNFGNSFKVKVSIKSSEFVIFQLTELNCCSLKDIFIGRIWFNSYRNFKIPFEISSSFFWSPQIAFNDLMTVWSSWGGFFPPFNPFSIGKMKMKKKWKNKKIFLLLLNWMAEKKEKSKIYTINGAK